MDSKKYEDARTYFLKVKGYEDSNSLLNDANYYAGIACISSKEYKKAVNADSEEGSKWSLQVYEHYCKENNIPMEEL